MARTEVKISMKKKYSACLYFKLLKSYPKNWVFHCRQSTRKNPRAPVPAPPPQTMQLDPETKLPRHSRRDLPEKIDVQTEIRTWATRQVSQKQLDTTVPHADKAKRATNTGASQPRRATRRETRKWSCTPPLPHCISRKNVDTEHMHHS